MNGGGGLEAAPGQDADRLLQRQDAPGQSRTLELHVPWVHVPASAGAGCERGYFTSFIPAVSPEALKAMGADLRELRIHHRTRSNMDDLARWLNPIVRGWMQYYGRFDDE